MTPWLIVSMILAAATAGLTFALVTILKQQRALIEQVKIMREIEHTNMILRLNKSGAGFRVLIAEINAILEQTRMENRQYIRRQQLLKSQISSISHDLRTPLTSVLGYLELAESEEDPEQRKEYLTIVRKRAEILQTLIVEFYDISSLEDPDRKISTELLDPLPILEDTVLTFYDEFSQRGIDLALRLNDAPQIEGSRPELIRVYSNLLRNILMHGSGSAHISHAESEGIVRTIFSNQIKAGSVPDQSRLFERFYSGDPSRGPEAGSGLGLYTVKLLLEKMGHTITVKIEDDVLTLVISYGAGEEK